jgi:hypothetical protein
MVDAAMVGATVGWQCTSTRCAKTSGAGNVCGGMIPISVGIVEQVTISLSQLIKTGWMFLVFLDWHEVRVT